MTGHDGTCREMPTDAPWTERNGYVQSQARMARGSHGLPKVLLGPAMPYPSMLCRQTTPEKASCSFLGMVSPQGFCPIGYPMPYGPVLSWWENGDFGTKLVPIGVWHGVSKGVDYGNRLPIL
jgi:hypothetical protein